MITEDIEGFVIHRAALNLRQQEELVEACRAIAEKAPLVRPLTAWGKHMSVKMTSAGRVGWVIERGKYRYADRHPATGTHWPPIPEQVLAVWREYSGWPTDPDSCLMNWYDAGAKMGLHQDKDEGDFNAPVVSISLGDPARFRMGGTERGLATKSTILESGDVVVMGGAARLAYHGIDRILTDGPHTYLLEGRGRINLTLRAVAET